MSLPRTRTHVGGGRGSALAAQQLRADGFEDQVDPSTSWSSSSVVVWLLQALRVLGSFAGHPHQIVVPCEVRGGAAEEGWRWERGCAFVNRRLSERAAACHPAGQGATSATEKEDVIGVDSSGDSFGAVGAGSGHWSTRAAVGPCPAGDRGHVVVFQFRGAGPSDEDAVTCPVDRSRRRSEERREIRRQTTTSCR